MVEAEFEVKQAEQKVLVNRGLFSFLAIVGGLATGAAAGPLATVLVTLFCAVAVGGGLLVGRENHGAKKLREKLAVTRSKSLTQSHAR